MAPALLLLLLAGHATFTAAAAAAAGTSGTNLKPMKILRGRYVSVRVGAQQCDVGKFGAVGDGETDDTAAIQKAMDACAKGGGGTVSLAAGKTYLVFSVAFSGSNMELHIPEGRVTSLVMLEGTEEYPL